ncbi:hypothetical protein CBL_09298 [Carabus blaptoides fortunei]
MSFRQEAMSCYVILRIVNDKFVELALARRKAERVMNGGMPPLMLHRADIKNVIGKQLLLHTADLRLATINPLFVTPLNCVRFAKFPRPVARASTLFPSSGSRLEEAAPVLVDVSLYK